jgi:hypothetical protein
MRAGLTGIDIPAEVVKISTPLTLKVPANLIASTVSKAIIGFDFL